MWVITFSSFLPIDDTDIIRLWPHYSFSSKSRKERQSHRRIILCRSNSKEVRVVSNQRITMVNAAMPGGQWKSWSATKSLMTPIWSQSRVLVEYMVIRFFQRNQFLWNTITAIVTWRCLSEFTRCPLHSPTDVVLQSLLNERSAWPLVLLYSSTVILSNFFYTTWIERARLPWKFT